MTATFSHVLSLTVLTVAFVSRSSADLRFLLSALFFLGLDLIKAIIQTVMTKTDWMWGVWTCRGPVYIGPRGDIAIKMSDIISDCH